jgi:hypothetical protein
MKQTIHTILSDPEARKKKIVKKNLTEEYTAGVPWFNVT